MSPHAVSPDSIGSPVSERDEHTYQTNGWAPNNIEQLSSHLRPSSPDETYDLICAGFGPASLAIAIALHDAIESKSPPAGLSNIGRRAPKVLFIEKQERFGWHEGMLLPGATMQISFIKDLATLRNPRSEFTFLNYLHCKDRLCQFTNMDTFLPQRVEYADYMAWCASHFTDVAQYSSEVISVVPEQSMKQVKSFSVAVKDLRTGALNHLSAKNVVIAVGGKAQIPEPFPQNNKRILHSSWYAKSIHNILPDQSKPYNIAVVGSGQSSAEIFNDLQTRYPNANTKLIIRSAALKPSDDSPFVNEIFDPNQVDDFYARSEQDRMAAIASSRDTNYGVVRPALLQHIYDALYMQRIKNPVEETWQHQIIKCHTVVGVNLSSKDSIELQLKDTRRNEEKMMDLDLVIVAAGYTRDAHEAMLEPVRHLTASGKKFEVARDYKVKMAEGKISNGAGVWLQGCNERTHGLSDSLLSILATRGGDLVDSIFGDREQ